MKSLIKAVFHWLCAFGIAFCVVNLLCFPYERPAGWFDTPNGPSLAGWRPGSVIVHGTEGYGITRVDHNGYLNREGELTEGYTLMMGSSHTQGKEVSSDQKYSALVNDYFSKDSGLLYTYNISCDGNFLPSLIKHFPAAVEAFPGSGMITLEISSTDFSERELENALCQVTYDPQSSIATQFDRMSPVGTIKMGIKEYFPLLSMIKKKLETSAAIKSDVVPVEREAVRYGILLNNAMALIRGQYEGEIVFVYHPSLILEKNGEVRISYSETWELFQGACRTNNISVIDMGPVFLDHYEKTKQLPYGFSNTTPGAGHLNQVGHRLIAQRLIAFMEETE